MFTVAPRKHIFVIVIIWLLLYPFCTNTYEHNDKFPVDEKSQFSLLTYHIYGK